ncbi:unnamed protein product [Penicillium roqueforti FM164]|uniref:Genomic scaffold, ProqFM164S03 n=1 Tax=Penicillium roqueforti (strain FM164) TaxID=1365484 RepID=W6QH04_PENRF|nr:unnamed protein product [Penicillium roqueforti FM164]
MSNPESNLESNSDPTLPGILHGSIGPNSVYTADSPGTCRAVDVASRQSTWFAYASAVSWPLSLTASLYPSTARHVLKR